MILSSYCPLYSLAVNLPNCKRFHSLMAVKMDLVGGHLRDDDGVGMFLRNVCNVSSSPHGIITQNTNIDN